MHLTPADWSARLDVRRSVLAFEHGTRTVQFSAPRVTNAQEPHARDEVHVVISGSGTFMNGDRRDAFAVGDLLFVPAGFEHRFEDFTDELAVWVVFYGAAA